MIYPKFIKKGSKIGVPAPSSGAWDELKKAKFANAEVQLQRLGFNLDVSPNINICNKYRSADAKTRAEEINRMFADNSIDAIICASGGEFLVEILPYVDFDLLVKNPKWVQGFSDPTGLLYTITTKYDIATMYGNNFGSYGTEVLEKYAEDSLQMLQGNVLEQTSSELYEEEREEKNTGLEGPNYTGKTEWKILNGDEVHVKGRCLAGCYDLITEIAGTKYDGTSGFIEKYKDDGIIWFFDNCEISYEEVIRSLWKLSELGYFKYTKAVVFGRCGSGVRESEIYTMPECLKDSVLSELNIPIVYDADVSHKAPCLAYINGAIATLDVVKGKAKINFELK